MSLHSSSLYRRGLGTHENIFINIERILHIPSWMILRQVQCLKVIILLLDFWAYFHSKAHLHKDIFDFHQGHSQWMDMTTRCTASWQSNVNLLICQTLLKLLLPQLFIFLCNQLFQLLTSLINNLTNTRAILLGQLSHTSQDTG